MMWGEGYWNGWMWLVMGAGTLTFWVVVILVVRALLPTLGAPEVYLQWQEGLIDADGNIGPNSRAFLQGWMDRFVAWVRLHNA